MTISLVRTAGDSRSVSQILGEARELAGPFHRAAVDVLPAEIRHVAGYHAGWWDAGGRPAGTAGKAVRPALALVCARAAGGRAAAGVDAAVAVELVHDFSLLHDDVMDGDLTRRGRPAAWVVFGVSQAILVGDVLLVAAMQQLMGSGTASAACGDASVPVLAAAVQELCEGQSADLAFEERPDVTLGECLMMAEGKTGALLGAACQLGALAGGADAGTAGMYRIFGRRLGMAFQLVDDLLGIWGDPEVTGKPVGSDLASRKKSLPVVAALSSGTSAGEDLAWLYGQEGELDKRAIERAAHLIEQAGGRAWAQSEADSQVQAAFEALTAAGPEPGAAADLRVLAAVMTHRDH